ncbi:hypothetical protein BSKO_06629 [Bryopsis sp. KO-2023]|nr:hypothetical protein BSKO_06629 [Bryopsis sp. KO-2023]
MSWRACLLIVLVHGCCAARQAAKDSADEKTAKSTKAKVVFDRMVSFPEDGESDVILLRNIGGKTADLKGWWLSDSRNDKSNPEATYFFGKTRGCGDYRKIPAGGVLELTPYLKSNPCGFPFGVSNKEDLHLFDDEDELVAEASWDWSLQGLVMRRLPDGSFQRFQENKKTMNVLHDMEDSELFIEALKGAGLYEGLYAESDKEADPLPDFPFKSPNEVIQFQLADAEGKKRKKSSKWPVEDQTAQFNGVPSEGPFTILAPTSDAIKEFLDTWEPAEGLDKWEVFKLPEFKEIMEHHILPGSWMSGWVFDGLPISTSAGKDVVAFKGENTDGDILFHEACHDDEAPGKYSCKERKELGLCEKENDSCQKSCGRCECTDETCAKVVQADIYGTNGFVHVIDKVLIPGKPSKKRKAKKPEESPDESDNKEDEDEDSNDDDKDAEVDEDEGSNDDDKDAEVEDGDGDIGVENVDASDIQDEDEDDPFASFDEDDPEVLNDEEEDVEDEEVDESEVDFEDPDESGDGEVDEEDAKDTEESEADTEDADEESGEEDFDREEEDDEASDADSEDGDEESGGDELEKEEEEEEESRVREDEDAELEKSEPFSLLTQPEDSEEEEETFSLLTKPEESKEEEESELLLESEENSETEEDALEGVDSNGLKTKRRRKASPVSDEADEEDEESDKSKKPISKRAARRMGREFPTGL